MSFNRYDVRFVRAIHRDGWAAVRVGYGVVQCTAGYDLRLRHGVRRRCLFVLPQNLRCSDELARGAGTWTAVSVAAFGVLNRPLGMVYLHHQLLPLLADVRHGRERRGRWRWQARLDAARLTTTGRIRIQRYCWRQSRCRGKPRC